MLISPSILNADFAKLKDCIEMLNHSAADWIHLDIMDGVFVPNISFGFPVISAVSKLAQKPLDTHLMVVSPEKFIDRLKAAGVSSITVQYEACTHLHRTLELILKAGLKAGVAINPHTPVSVLEEVAGMVNLILIMSVNPGFGGQQFIPYTLNKVTSAKELLLRRNSQALIEIDGGVNLHNAAQLQSVGADVLVAGSVIFSAQNPASIIEQLSADMNTLTGKNNNKVIRFCNNKTKRSKT